MKTPPLYAFGFSYQYRGREYATHIEAATSEDAIAHIRALAGAELVGQLVPVEMLPRAEQA